MSSQRKTNAFPGGIKPKTSAADEAGQPQPERPMPAHQCHRWEQLTEVQRMAYKLIMHKRAPTYENVEGALTEVERHPGDVIAEWYGPQQFRLEHKWNSPLAGAIATGGLL